MFIDHNQISLLIQDFRLRAVKFVGSTSAGKKIAEICGKAMKKGAFELGGSDPFIVLDDADIELATSKAIPGRLKSNGQSCNNAKRFIVSSQIYDQFKEKLVQKLNDYIRIGDPMDNQTTLGPLANNKQLDLIRKQVSDSIANGARVIYGEVNFQIQDSNLKNGYYFHPIVLENITKEQPAFSEELFAPVFSLFTFDTIEEAINIANSVSYGLSASIFSSNVNKAKEVALKIDVGNIFINEIVGSDPSVPNGGVKDSGYGRELFKDGLFEIINRKTIVVAK